MKAKGVGGFAVLSYARDGVYGVRAIIEQRRGYTHDAQSFKTPIYTFMDTLSIAVYFIPVPLCYLEREDFSHGAREPGLNPQLTRVMLPSICHSKPRERATEFGALACIHAMKILNRI
jgi:hypothetical protein